MNYLEEKKIYDKATKIVNSKTLDWKTKYELIFSEEVSLHFNFDWYDPDMDYEDDVKAFMNGFKDYIEKRKLIAIATEEI